MVVVDSILNAVVRVNKDGDRTIISDNEMGMGMGPAFMSPFGIAVEDDGSLVVVDSILKAVVRVDPTTGNRMIISDNEMGMGPAFMSPFGIAVEADGSLVVVDPYIDLRAVVRVNKDGDRTIISKRIDTGDEIDMNMVGLGPAFLLPSGIAVEPDGSLVVVDSVLNAVVRVNKDGNRMIISKRIDTGDEMDMGMVGSGPAFVRPSGIAVEADGSLVVVDFGLAAVVRVNKDGDRMIISKRIDTGDEMDMGMVGSGPAFMSPFGIAVEADGSLVVVDSVLKAVVRVDPTTGNRMIISDNEMGMGPAFMSPFGIAVEAW